MDYRPLTADEITRLKKNGCTADQWNTIKVAEGFVTEAVRQTHFSGPVKLGICSGNVGSERGRTRQAGIVRCTIHDCTIDDNVALSNIGRLAGYHISKGAVVENVATLETIGETSFGNGVTVHVLNEAGGREIPIFDTLSSQLAYIIATCRHDQPVIENLSEWIGKYAAERRSEVGFVGEAAIIENCGVVRNVRIGPHAMVSGASFLEEGTVGSAFSDPTYIGESVTAKNFIVASGSRIESGAMLTECFVGQGVRIGKQFSAENSLFFANCEGFHSEAVSCFAGPYTVTHHKSTLLIAGIFSFFNAGSGTNQSNHLYKFGPVHQGIVERGSKTGSSSYLLWPSRIGAYSVVIGKHLVNMDTSDLPFSYISEEEGKSILTPAMNLFTVGTRRDSIKWPARDRRRDPEKFDLIHFDLFNPCTIGKILRAIDLLDSFQKNTPREREYVSHNGIQIKRLLLKTCSKYYELAVKIYIGTQLLNRIGDEATIDAVREALSCRKEDYSEQWVDAAGMYIPLHAYRDLLRGIGDGRYAGLPDLASALRDVHRDYDRYAWTWCAALIERRYGIAIDRIEAQHIVRITEDWKENAIKLNNMILKDAEKEYDSNSRIGYGIDGDKQTGEADFKQVRGTYGGNKFVTELKEESEKIILRAGKITELFRRMV